MRRTVSNLIVIGLQLLIVGLFFVTIFNKNVKFEKHVSTVHNENLNKIATSVSLLFAYEETDDADKKLEDMTLKELPSIDDVEAEAAKKKEEQKVEVKEEVTTPLVSDAMSKYANKTETGFEVTNGNKTYSLSADEFNIVSGVIACEAKENSVDDALAVASVILNRADARGMNPFSVVSQYNQFSCYTHYTNNPSKYQGRRSRYVDSVLNDALSGIRNNKYNSFNCLTCISDIKKEEYGGGIIVAGGNWFY